MTLSARQVLYSLSMTNVGRIDSTAETETVAPETVAPETMAPETIGTFGTKALGFASWTISLAFLHNCAVAKAGWGWEHGSGLGAKRRYARHRAV